MRKIVAGRCLHSCILLPGGEEEQAVSGSSEEGRQGVYRDML